MKTNKQRLTKPFSIFGDVLNVTDITKEYLLDIANNVPLKKTNKKIEYYNIPCAFDIEVSSFYSSQLENAKCACMYIWQFGIFDTVIVGRTWEEFVNFINLIVECFDTSINKRLVCYVHNLSYEFQFICKRFEWDSVFAVRQRKPVKALTVNGIEFRCSYILSGKALSKLDLQTYHVKKLVGNLDYKKIRHSGTPLTNDEMRYCINDIKVLLAYIQEKIEVDGDITKIPLTKTGYVRDYCRKACYNGDKKKYFKYRQLMEDLTLTVEEYKMALQAFQGGFTHANAWYTGKVIENVRSFDFTSSYPFVMVANKFPMSKGRKYIPTSKDDFLEKLKKYCCLIEVTFYNVYSSTIFEHPISFSRCYNYSNIIVDNGRIVSADRISMTITEQDFEIYSKFYNWEHFELHKMYIYYKAYLPTALVKSIIDLYEKKTVLKGVDGEELEYLLSKEKINSVFGMCVTNIIQPEYIYDGEWTQELPNVEEAIENYNNSKKRFISYLFGVWVTAYARRNLFSGIYECKEDYIYSDTDSLKIINYERHADYFEWYNEQVKEKIKQASEFHKISIEKFSPKTINGETKIIGVWDDEGECTFKTLGAKRYAVYKDGKYNITVSGVNKKVAVPYLLEKAKKENTTLFELFDNNLYIPSKYTGKNTHTYIDEPRKGQVVDYLGNQGTFDEFSSIHMEEADYSLSLATQYIDYLKGLRMEERL